MELKRAIFMDRDGTVNVWPIYDARDVRYPGYVTTWADFEFVPDAQQAFELLLPTDYKIIVISNQGGIGAGFAKRDDVLEIFTLMGGQIIMWADKDVHSYFCPHDPKVPCACRKPKPGLIYKAAIEHQIDLSRSWMIGDRHEDMTAGWNAGIRQLIRVCDRDAYYRPIRLEFNTAGGYPVCTLLEAVILAIGHGR